MRMLREEAENRVAMAANRDAEVHQHQHPGELLCDAWAKTRWALVVHEPALVEAALALGDDAFGIYFETLGNAVRVISKLVEIRVEHWLDLALDTAQRKPLTAEEIESINLKLPKRDQVALIRAGGAEVVANYTRHWR